MGFLLEKKYINYAIIVCAIAIFVSSVIFALKALVDWDEKVPDSFMNVKEIPAETSQPNYPKTIAFQYSIKKGMPIVGEDKHYVYGKIDESSSHRFYAIDIQDDTYHFLTGRKKGYPFTDVFFYDVTYPFQFKDNTGVFEVRFLNEEQYVQFMSDIEEGEKWRSIFNYYLEQKEKKDNKK